MVYRILLLSCFLVSFRAVAQKSKIDSVVCHHFTIVDSAIHLLKRNDDLLLKFDYHSSMHLFERVSGINADRRQNYSAASILTEDTVLKWKAWFGNHYDELVWTEDKINRKDYDVYQSRIRPRCSILTGVSSKELPDCLQ